MTAINIIKKSDKSFPFLLKQIPNPPEKLYVIGELPDNSSANGPKIAIVGTRKATTYGRSFAKKLAQKLSELGAIVVSGLAMGIDTAAHEGAVLANGKTIAVLANGLDKIYPAQNENLAKKILETGGAIISEYPAGTPSFQNQFLERNRIISGLSIATVVIEAPERSGSLVTARLAAEQGREVFVVPGLIDNPNYRGSHKLIRDGARLVASIEDIIEDLSDKIPNYNPPANRQIANKSQIKKIKDKNQLLIFTAVEKAGRALDIDEIIEITKLEPQAVNSAVALMTINEIIKETEKGYSL